MYISKIYFVLCLFLALFVGLGVSCLYGNENMESEQLSGDISKVKLYNKTKTPDPETSIVEEKLKNDSTFRFVTQYTMEFMTERVALVGELADKSIAVCSQIPEMNEMLLTFESLKAKAYNTNLAIEMAREGMKKIEIGQSAPEYELAANNSYIGYQKIANQMNCSREFVNAAQKYIENDGEKSSEMEELISAWARYNVQDAILNESEENISYWDKKVSDFDKEDLFGNSPIANLKIRLAKAVNENNDFHALSGGETQRIMLTNKELRTLNDNLAFHRALSGNQQAMLSSSSMANNLIIIVIAIIPINNMVSSFGNLQMINTAGITDILEFNTSITNSNVVELIAR